MRIEYAKVCSGGAGEGRGSGADGRLAARSASAAISAGGASSGAECALGAGEGVVSDSYSSKQIWLR